jgi:phosphate transport system permease protein
LTLEVLPVPTSSQKQSEVDSGAVKAPKRFEIHRRRMRFLGLTLDDVIKYIFGGNAIVSVVVLALITLFLFKEGAGFFGQNKRNLLIYRKAGLEYVDKMRLQESDYSALSRYLSDLRVRAVKNLISTKALKPAELNSALADYDAFAAAFGDAADPLRALLSDCTDTASAIKTKYLVAEDRKEERRQLLAEGKVEAAAKVVVDPIDFRAELQPLLATRAAYHEINVEFKKAVLNALVLAPTMHEAGLQKRLDRFKELTRQYLDGFPTIEQDLASWDPDKEIPWHSSVSSFIFGREWLTASFWQDWYGIIPLLVGSLMVSFVALALAVPFGIGAALYVNQLATRREQYILKPCIEFISAIPSVVLGFFGIAVLGQALRAISGWDMLSWVPGFPFSERLNILTAGCLLALIAVPTIFTLAEDALNNVPRAFSEASFALGASRLQTIVKIIAPAALSGIVSAILLGLGRVIGETMVVLLCAGNRISIPDFSSGLGVVTQPVHTMTGIIAQEMGEVVRGSIHYRALFVVGIVLFFLSLLINYLAQKIVNRYRISIG